MIKTGKLFLHCLLLFIFCSSSSPSWAKESKITIESVSVQENAVILAHNQKGSLKIKQFSLPSSQRGYTRLVYDFSGALLKSKHIGNSKKLSPIKVRIGQFSSKPAVSRLVFEGPKDKVNELKLISNQGNKVLIGFSKADIKEIQKQPIKTVQQEKKKKIQHQKLSENLSIESGNPTKITISAGQKIDYRLIRLSNPERLVVDLKNWPSKPNKLLGSKGKESELLLGVRAGMPFKKSKTVRLVFDLARKNIKHTDKLLADNKKLQISLSHSGKATDSEKAKINKLKPGFKVVVDAGHGGYDRGAMHGGIEEKDLTLKIAKQVTALLLDANVQVTSTRKADVFVSLDKRVQKTIATKPDLFISIHCNALGSSSKVHGIETYYYTPQSKELGATLHRHLLKATKARDRRLRSARFVVIRRTSIPSVLLELGFLTNAAERAKLNNASYQKDIAEAISAGIIEYLSN